MRKREIPIFFSEGSQALFACPGKFMLIAVTTKTGDGSCSIRKNRRGSLWCSRLL